MSFKKKIIIAISILLVFILGVMILFVIKSDKNKSTNEDNSIIYEDTEEQPTSKPQNTNKNNTEPQNPEDEVRSLSKEEAEEFDLIMNIQSNRSINASPTYDFKKSSFETVPKADNWFEDCLKSTVSGVFYPELEYITKVEVFNYPETKTNFIIVYLNGTSYVYQMYRAESDEKITYEYFDTENKFDKYYKIISRDSKKIFSKDNPRSFDIGNW